MMRLYLLALLLSAFFLIPSIAKSEEPVRPYSRSFIDRPYTLPKGMHAAEAWALQQIGINPTGSGFTFGIPIPAYDLPLDSDLTLVVFPVSAGIRYQVLRNEEQEVGLSFFAGYSYQSQSGLKFRPSFSVFRRQYFFHNLSLDADIVLNPIFPFQGGGALWASAVTLGPLWQVHPHLALRPLFSLSLSQTFFLPPGAIVELFENSRRPVGDARFTVPLGLWVGASLNEHWDLSGTYSYEGIGLGQGYQNHIFFLKANYVW